ncbi:mechanosensitive ion channel family protein [Natronosporangium hydrolyticum]|uniref:Mechanosensitive ion channel family protein n=1 Tax=Natronosporangium hydrolyticum TaxID=2811111 RepID=A0A895YSX7_9ACTN|nr:mechanosensitive ion channel family protein [Natronosporangium hydrolyticum]QSB17138.1 mechanosensitive ion channel family protein [Natronosporangium hydrolyticum]
MLAQAPLPDCLEDNRLCRWLWELSGQVWVAEGGTAAVLPLRIALIVLMAIIFRWLLRRAVNRLVRRTSNGNVPTLLRPLPERVRTTVHEATTLISPERRRQRAEAIGSVLRSAVTIAIFGIAGLLILSELDLHLGPLLAGAGIVGVALGFGAQSLVKDLLAGLFMLLEDQYGVGDLVDVGEASGTVEAVGLRITTLRDLNGVFWYVPNGEIRRVGNRSQGSATVVVDMPIGFAPMAAAAEALRQGAQRLADDVELRGQLVEPPEVLGVDQVTVEGAVVRTIVKTTPDAQWQIGRELRRRQTEALEEAGLAEKILAARVYPRDPGGAGNQP